MAPFLSPMRTADSIAQQAELANSERKPTPTARMKRGTHPNSLKNLRPPWKPGECPNPSGRPKHDVASSFARAVIEGSLDVAFAGFVKQLAKGNAYAFKELAERGYGKLKEHIQITDSEEVVRRLLTGRQKLSKERGR